VAFDVTEGKYMQERLNAPEFDEQGNIQLRAQQANPLFNQWYAMSMRIDLGIVHQISACREEVAVGWSARQVFIA
jgi:hypothetical protein